MKCTCPTQRPNARDPTQPIFHWKWGLRLLPNAKKSTQKNEMYMADAKNWRHPTPEIPTCWYILRWVTPKCWRRGHCPTPAPDARYFAFWWNIGFKHFFHKFIQILNLKRQHLHSHKTEPRMFLISIKNPYRI